MSEYYTLITDIGKKKLAEAVAKKTTLELAAFAVGDGDYEPTGKETQLKHENYRSLINSKDIDPDNIEQIRLELIIPANVGGWYIREIGLFDIDKDLFAIAKYPETYKPAPNQTAIIKQFIIKAYLKVVNTANVTLTVRAENIATKDYVDNTLRANQKETIEGINNSKYVTPQTLHNKKASTKVQGLTRFATPEEAINPLIDDVALSPKNVIPLLDIKPKSITTDKLADLSVTTEKIADESIVENKIKNDAVTTKKIADETITPDKIKKKTSFEFGAIAVPREDGNRMLFNNHAFGIESADKSQYSAFLFDDFGRPRISGVAGDNRVVVIKDIAENGRGIVASGENWIKFADGLLLQTFIVAIWSNDSDIKITLPVSFNKSYIGYASLYNCQHGVPTTAWVKNISNSQINISLTGLGSVNQDVAIFCIGY